MAYTPGFSCQISDLVTQNVPFAAPHPTPNQTICSSYIIVPTTGSEGGFVYENPAGEICYWPYAFVGYNPVAARQILTSATINGVNRTTTAAPLYWAGTYGE
jgi:hypothetical protein